MKTIILSSDLSLLYVAADSFPDGVPAAFAKLEAMLPSRKARKFFGIYDESGNGSSYKAAVVALHAQEALQYGCAYTTIPKGSYLAKTIENWQNNIDTIAGVFDELHKQPKVAADSPSIEYYKTHDKLVCMVLLKESGEGLQACGV